MKNKLKLFFFYIGIIGFLLLINFFIRFLDLKNLFPLGYFLSWVIQIMLFILTLILVVIGIRYLIKLTRKNSG